MQEQRLQTPPTPLKQSDKAEVESEMMLLSNIYSLKMSISGAYYTACAMTRESVNFYRRPVVLVGDVIPSTSFTFYVSLAMYQTYLC